MPSHDGFVRLSTSHCDHNAGLFDRCDPCSAGNRRCYTVLQQTASRWSVAISVLQLDTPWMFIYGDLTREDLYNLTSKLADAGWSQSTSTAA